MHLGSATPHPGRDYESAVSVYLDFVNNKDFIIGGPHINKQDCLVQLPNGGSINIRYKSLRQVAVIAWDANGKVTVNGKTPSEAQLKAAKMAQEKRAERLTAARAELIKKRTTAL